jgi:hypothetical protein
MAEAAVPIVVAPPEGEDLGKKCKKRQTDVFKHPCRDVWLAGWSRLEPQPS